MRETDQHLVSSLVLNSGLQITEGVEVTRAKGNTSRAQRATLHHQEPMAQQGGLLNDGGCKECQVTTRRSGHVLALAVFCRSA
jgi:hypothetical protein